MGMNYIDAGMLKNAFLAGAKGLEANKEWINELNVFPVPDGDTGTNMTMTIMSAAAEVSALTEPDMETLRSRPENLMVTPRDIDQQVRDLGKVIGYSINWALQDLEIEEINALLS